LIIDYLTINYINSNDKLKEECMNQVRTYSSKINNLQSLKQLESFLNKYDLFNTMRNVFNLLNKEVIIDINGNEFYDYIKATLLIVWKSKITTNDKKNDLINKTYSLLHMLLCNENKRKYVLLLFKNNIELNNKKK